MITVAIRTFLIYLSLNIALRILGKRQIGELEISDLITTLLLSEIASLPITNHEIPVMFAVMLILTVPTLIGKRLYRAQGIILLCIYAAFCTLQFVM